jgi:hypothetical protein
MKIYTEMDLTEFEGWSGACDTLAELTEVQKKELQNYIEELYPDGLTETELNDYLRFETYDISQILGFIDFEDLINSNSANFGFIDSEELINYNSAEF